MSDFDKVTKARTPEEAHAVLVEACKRGHLRMTVPVQPDDDDVVLGQAIDQWAALRAELEKVRADRDEERAIRHRLAGSFVELQRRYDAALSRAEVLAQERERFVDCHGGPGTTSTACEACLTCLDRARDIAESQLRATREALRRIAAWEMPPATDRDGRPSVYGAEYGSNGERDFILAVARTALGKPLGHVFLTDAARAALASPAPETSGPPSILGMPVRVDPNLPREVEFILKPPTPETAPRNYQQGATMDRKCCFIPCEKAAEFTIYAIPSESPDDYTDACAEHVTALFDARTEQRVFRLAPSAAPGTAPKETP
jgi:hypothetical protein